MNFHLLTLNVEEENIKIVRKKQIFKGDYRDINASLSTIDGHQYYHMGMSMIHHTNYE